MNKLLFTILIAFLGIPIIAQDIHFPSSIIAAGGSAEGSPLNLSRWRLAPIHVLTLPERPGYLNEDAGWKVSVYPVPAQNHLYLKFELPEQKELYIQITDLAGRIVYVQEPTTFLNGSIVELDLSTYSPELYLLRISSPDLTTQQVCRFQKL